MQYDFLADVEPREPLIPEVAFHGPNATSMKKITRKDVIQDFLDVYAEEDMGKQIIRAHMKADPKSFFDVLKKFIPNQMSLDAGEMLNLKVIDRYGTATEISAMGADPNRAHGRGLTSPESTDQPQITLTEKFEVGLPSKTAASSNPPLVERASSEFDFEL